MRSDYRVKTLHPQFEPEPRFEVNLDAACGRGAQENALNALHARLLDGELGHTTNLKVVPAIRQAAIQAASVAWASGFPLLTFPGLFLELVQQARVRSLKQEIVRAKSECILSAAI